MKNREYCDWFGKGDTNKDVKKVIDEHGQPLNIFYEEDGFMAVVIYENKAFCVGYDGCEYHKEEHESNNL